MSGETFDGARSTRTSPFQTTTFPTTYPTMCHTGRDRRRANHDIVRRSLPGRGPVPYRVYPLLVQRLGHPHAQLVVKVVGTVVFGNRSGFHVTPILLKCESMLIGKRMVRFEEGRAVPTAAQQDGVPASGMAIHKVAQIVVDPMDRPQLSALQSLGWLRRDQNSRWYAQAFLERLPSRR